MNWMNRKFRWDRGARARVMIGCVVMAWGSAGSLFGQGSAPSAHFNFGKGEVGDISVCEVRVPEEGLVAPTYYETLGFRGNKGNGTGNGYGGIQKSDSRRGSDVHIFSIWHAIDDPSDKANFPYAAHLGHGTTAEHFGGEGVGLKTWNFKLKWKPDVWYSHVVRCWDVGDDTHYGFFVSEVSTGRWLHLSTIGVREPGIRIQGANDAFIEDWKATGEKMREMHLRNVWRRDLQGDWHGARSGVYSVNSWDLEEGKRSFDFRRNWDAGIRKDGAGGYYYMRSGGKETRPTEPLKFPTRMRHSFTLGSAAKKPGYAGGQVEAVTVERDGSELTIGWEMAEIGLPQFGYEVALFGGAKCEGEPLLTLGAVAPGRRAVVVDLKGVEGTARGVRVRVRDLFDGVSEKVRAL